jgi:putative transposase
LGKTWLEPAPLALVKYLSTSSVATTSEYTPMKAAVQRFLLLLASATDRALAKQVQYLKHENEILRSKLPKRIEVTPQEKARLIKFGKPLGTAIRELITIVTPRTFLRWINGESSPKHSTKGGRPRTKAEIQELILHLARESGWGYTRILGELKKLGIRSVCRSTVIKILKENGLDPGPKRGEGSWEEFIKQHAATLWACDFFSKKVWTASGLVEMFLLFFIHVGSRRVHLAGMTAHPNAGWMVQQARNVSMFMAEQEEAPRFLLRDRDTKFTQAFDAIFESDGVEVVKVAVRAPNMNAFAERIVQSIKTECLNNFIVFGEKHLRHLLTEYLAHYHEERPHQGVGNVLLSGQETEEVESLPLDQVRCSERLGGLLKHFYRAA